MKKMKKYLCVSISFLLLAVCMGSNIHADILGGGKRAAREHAKSCSVSSMEEFLEKMRGEFTEYHGEFKEDTEEKDIIVWEFPYSDIKRGQTKSSFSKLNFVYLYINTEAPDYMWGYFEGEEDLKGWICLNEPNNKDMQYVEVEYTGYHNDNKRTNQNVFTYLVVLLVLLIASTVTALIVISKNNKNKAVGK